MRQLSDVKVSKFKKIQMVKQKMPSVSIVSRGSVICRHVIQYNFTAKLKNPTTL
jgi:hypothetical protein